MDIETLDYFREKYECRKLMFMSQGQHWSWVYHVLYYLICLVDKQTLDKAIASADEKESISLTRN